MKYFDEAAALYKSRKYEEAKKSISKSIDEDPEFSEAYLVQGNIALKKKDDKLLEIKFGVHVRT